jgi:formate/nitrite transporter FocA (FNT family)
MTPLEIVGATTLVMLGFSVLGRLFPRREPNTIDIEVATEHVAASVREAFESGMLCAADIATHEGHEALAGRIRKTVEYCQEANDN